VHRRRIFHPPESHIEVVSVYYQEQESRPACFCNTGSMKKTGTVWGGKRDAANTVRHDCCLPRGLTEVQTTRLLKTLEWC
jgi:hypothetical protein